MKKKPFAGMVLLGLREPRQFDHVSSTVRTGGGRAIAIPAYRIENIDDCSQALYLLSNPGQFSWTLFASPNAVAALRNIALRNNLKPDPNMRVAGPGGQTVRSLQAAGFKRIATHPQAATFAALLASGVLDPLAGKRVALVQRAEAPRQAANEVRRRKAMPFPIPCYRLAPAGADMWAKLDASVRDKANCLMAHDAAALRILLDRAGDDAERLLQLPLGVHHEQTALKARNMGFKNIIAKSNLNELLNTLVDRIAHRA